ncbi:MAG TPA: hypothetical protein VJY34_01825, partial [Roseiarcus sp.]|nr:hypothetical protein [Roseiarcus sp.]
MSPEDRIRLRHIADGLDSAGRFTQGRKREDLDGDEMLVFALMHALHCGRSRGADQRRDSRPVPRSSVGEHDRDASSLGTPVFRHQTRQGPERRHLHALSLSFNNEGPLDTFFP